nr:HAD family phosphatase [Bacilli bacterium]
MISTFLFDIHQVFFLRSEKRYQAICDRFSIKGDELSQAIFADQLWDRYKVGAITEKRFWHDVVAALPDTFSGTDEELCDAMDDVDELDEELVRFVRRCKKKYKIAALSNAGEDLERRLRRYGYEDLFDDVINSYRIGLAKPDNDCYHYALDRLGVKPEEVLFVDDKERNTVIAHQLGMHTYVYTKFFAFQDWINKQGL